jgi:hypothetical protein
MQAPGSVLLNDESVPAAPAGLSARLRRDIETAFLAIRLKLGHLWIAISACRAKG